MKLRTEGLSWQEIDGELVILDLKTSNYLTTNAAGTTLAKLLTADRTHEELAAALRATYGIDQQTADADSAAFVAELRDKSLLEA